MNERAPETGNIALAVVRRCARKVARAETSVTALKDERDRAIKAAHAAGIGSRAIADAAGLSNSGVRKIVGLDTS